MKPAIFLILLLLPVLSCNSPVRTDKQQDVGNSCAKGFSIRDSLDFRIITLFDPWQGSSGKQYRYLLSENTTESGNEKRYDQVIPVPVRSVVVLSTTHVGFISALGESSSITGVSGAEYVSDSLVRSSILSGACREIGYYPNLDFETVLKISPDLVILYGLDPSVSSIVSRLDEAGIRAVMVSEFLEDTPLGKAEWIRFFAAFYRQDKKADSIFRLVERNYDSLRSSVRDVKNRPSVLTGLPWKDTWYVSGGRSFTARFIQDAGGDFIWKDDLNSDFIPLDLESVFRKAVRADFWINTGTAEDLKSAGAGDERFKLINAFSEGMLYNNNRRMNSTGGNDFWESGAVRPDLILGDLICIFHPDKCSKQELTYYRKLN